MFFLFPLQHRPDLRQSVFLLNTVLLILALIAVELIYSETPKAKREQLKFFLPLFLVLVGLLIYGAYFQRHGL